MQTLCSPADQQGPLHNFDEADISTAQMALLASPGKQAPESPGALLHAKLTARRQLAAIKHRLERVGSLWDPLMRSYTP